jgi:hypothetical protein
VVRKVVGACRARAEREPKTKTPAAIAAGGSLQLRLDTIQNSPVSSDVQALRARMISKQMSELKTKSRFHVWNRLLL